MDKVIEYVGIMAAQTAKSKIKKEDVSVGAFGKFRPRYLIIGSRAFTQIIGVADYYNVFRHELFHKIIKEWQVKFFSNGKKTALSQMREFPLTLTGGDEYRAITFAIYDCDYKLLKEFCERYYYSGEKKTGRLFSKVIDWWIEENKELLTKINNQ